MVDTRVDPHEDVLVDLVLESLSNGIVATGTIDVPWTGECRRCLRPVTGRVRQRVQEVFGGEEGDEDAWPLDGDELELGPMVRDVAVGALPLAPLCSEDCRGPSPGDFPTGVAEEEAEPRRDPRWAALDDLDLEE